jgi:hypothetical protein
MRRCADFGRIKKTLMLAELQSYIANIYDADCGHRLQDFLITDRALANILGRKTLPANVEESVLVADDGDGIALSVFLDEALLARLDKADPLKSLRADELADLTVVLEGVSHFNYISWCASNDKLVTLLELELQAEIDKFVTTAMLAEEQQDFSLLRNLHKLLFDNFEFQPSLDRDERERYEVANSYAARFCRELLQRVSRDDGNEQLREFYRLTQPDKISYIHTLAWQN